MGFNKVGLTLLLLLCGAVLLGTNLGTVDAQVCPQICFAAAYMTCPSTGEEHLTPKCNCCLASQGCTLYYANGTAICTAT